MQTDNRRLTRHDVAVIIKTRVQPLWRLTRKVGLMSELTNEQLGMILFAVVLVIAILAQAFGKRDLLP